MPRRPAPAVPWPTADQVHRWLDGGDTVVLVLGLDELDPLLGLTPVDPAHLVDPAQLVHPDELARAERMATPALRRRTLHAYVLRRAVLGDLLDVAPADVRFRSAPCASCGGSHGRPELDHPFLRMNVSHAGGLLAVALRRGADVGVDLEVLGAMGPLPPARAWLTPSEQQALGAPSTDADGHMVLAQAWVAKEAVLKATGEGLTRPLPDAPVLDGEALEAWAPGMAVTLVAAGDDGWVGAVAGLDLAAIRVAVHPALDAAADHATDVPTSRWPSPPTLAR